MIAAGHAAQRSSATDPTEAALAIRSAVERTSLDLRGLVVLTEAATGAFAATASLAAVAGADRVFAIARDSAHGSFADAERETLDIAMSSGCSHAINVVSIADALTGNCDIVTNLGMVRPIDAGMVSRLKPTAVVALMCESWEFRPGDVDLAACQAHGIAVVGTNEHSPALPVFEYSGELALRLLSEAGVNVTGSRVAVLGRDAFTPVIAEALGRSGAVVSRDTSLEPERVERAIAGTHAIVVAEYASDAVVLGDGGIVPAARVATLAPGATIVQFAGAINEASLARGGNAVWPSATVGPRRMSRTFAHLGVRPVVELHALGLAGAALVARARLRGLAPDRAVTEAMSRSDIVQPVPSVAMGDVCAPR